MKNENDNISQSTAVYQEFKASSAFKKKKNHSNKSLYQWITKEKKLISL